MQIASSPGTSDRLTKMIKEMEDSEQKWTLVWNIDISDYFVTVPDDTPQEYIDLLNDLMEKAWKGEVVEKE